MRTNSYIGGSSWSGNNLIFDGQIKSVNVWTRALSASEIAYLYDSGYQYNLYTNVNNKKLLNELNREILGDEVVHAPFDTPKLPVYSDVLSQYKVNTTTSKDQINPQVSKLEDGGYVIVWQSYTSETSTYDIYAKRYDSTGKPVIKPAYQFAQVVRYTSQMI